MNMGSLKDQIIFLYKLNLLISSGAPFGDSFHIVKKETENKLLKKFADRMMQKDIFTNDKFTKCEKDFSKALPKTIWYALDLGEKGGCLDAVLTKGVNYLMKELEITKYPSETQTLLRLFNGLSFLFNCGAPLFQAMETIRDFIPNLHDSLDKTIDMIKKGYEVHEAMSAQLDFVPEFALNMMALGEAYGHLDKTFEKILEYLLFEARLELKQHSETICN